MNNKTQLGKRKAELDQVRAEGRKCLENFFVERDKKRGALKELLEWASADEKKQLRDLFRSQMQTRTEGRKTENKDLITQFHFLSDLVKQDEATLELVLQELRKRGPEDEKFYEQLRSDVMWEGEIVKLPTYKESGSKEDRIADPKAHHKEKALGTITESDLLNKPNMTAEDKKKMQDALNFMKSKSILRTDENLKKLYDNVHYHHNAVEIAGRKWSRSYRESSKVWPNTPRYISDPNDKDKPRAFYRQEKGLQYFNYQAALKEDTVMRKQGMRLPSKENFEATLWALPWDYEERKYYLGGSIFNLLLNGRGNFTGYCDSRGLFWNISSYSYLLSISPCDKDRCWCYISGVIKGELYWSGHSNAFPLRPLIQQFPVVGA